MARSDEVGIKFDQSKPRLSLVDPNLVEGMAVVLGQGEQKYGKLNWKLGLGYSRVIDAAKRHLAQIECGEDVDADSGMSHAVHVCCNMMFLDYYRRHHYSFNDDRHFYDSGDDTDVELPEMPSLPESESPQLVPNIGESAGVQAVPSPVEKSTEADPVKHLQQRVKQWADRVFPKRTSHGALVKLVLEEIPELLNGGLEDPLEYADVLILILDIASLNQIDAIAAAHRKMDINERRQWRVSDNGIMKHVKQEQDNG